MLRFIDFGTILVQIWRHFGKRWIKFDGFTKPVEDITLRIRATRGDQQRDRETERQRDRETERQRDRESRPNPLKDQGDSRKAPSPANFARFLGEFHSVAKQASFCNAFGRDFGGLWKPKWMQKLMLGLVFFDVVLECAFALILVRIFEAPNLKNQALASTGARFLQNRRFRKRFQKRWV